jgi:hypothetical protein
MAKNKNKNRKKGGGSVGSSVANAASVKDGVAPPDTPTADEIVETPSTENIGDVLVVNDDDEPKPDERLDTISPVLDASEARSESSEDVVAEPAVAVATVE